MNKKWILGAAGSMLLAGVALAATGHLPTSLLSSQPRPVAARVGPAPIAVSVTRIAPRDFTESVLVTGSLVAREEILVGPEIEGLRIVEVLADEGDRVTKGQVLARLVSDTLEAQLAQNAANLQRATAAIAQAQSTIASADARLVEARNAYNRGMPLKQSGYISESLMDQRESANRIAAAALETARDGLKVAEAERAQVEAQGRELSWRHSRTEIRAPADGTVSRRMARIGGYAAGAADALFRIIAKGEIELDAEVTEMRLPKIKQGQSVKVEAAGSAPVTGKVRLVSPEVDKATRLGRIRIFLGNDSTLHVGAFARGHIETGRSRGLAVPASAVLYGAEGASVQLASGGTVATRRVTLGLEDGNLVEVVQGLTEGDFVVTRSGTFLRDGDVIRPMLEPTALRVAG